MVNLSKFAEMLEELMFEHDTRHKTDAKTLAKTLGVEGSTITRYLRTEREPSIENLVLLADYFKCSAGSLIRGGKSLKTSTAQRLRIKPKPGCFPKA